MTTEAVIALRRFAGWICATDEHAQQRLELAARAEAALEAGADDPRFDRLDLAGRLERWRYQHLARRAGRLTAEDRRLVDALDLAANALAGRVPRPPRSARAAIHAPADPDGAFDEAMRCLNPATRLEAISQRAAELTQASFGGQAGDGSARPPRWRVLLYAPLYLSNWCVNHCVYCGFRYPHPVRRKHLELSQALREADILMGRGFRHLLLVAGDFPRLTTLAYYGEILRALRARGVDPAVEIAPQSTASYGELVRAGARGLTLYQETYNEELYAKYHPRGSKAWFDWRLEAPERAAEAGMPRLGLGILLGLADPREDLRAMMRHARYLQGRFPDRTLAFSLPRIHEAPPGFRARFPVDDDTFVRMYCALRIAFPRAELVLSTREPAALRNRLVQICITQMSAGSCTAPGGYEDAEADAPAGAQFPVSDHRSPDEVAAWLRDAGFAVAWTLGR